MNCITCGKPEEEHYAMMFCDSFENPNRRRFQPPKGSGVEILGETSLVTLKLKSDKIVKGVTRDLTEYSVDVHLLPGDPANEVVEYVEMGDIAEIIVHG